MRVHVSARVSDQCSIYTSQGVGGREKHRLQLQTETETGQSKREANEAGRGERVETERKSFEDSTSRERQLG